MFLIVTGSVLLLHCMIVSTPSVDTFVDPEDYRFDWDHIPAKRITLKLLKDRIPTAIIVFPVNYIISKYVLFRSVLDAYSDISTMASVATVSFMPCMLLFLAVYELMCWVIKKRN